MSPGCTAAESEIGTLAAAQIGAEQWQGSCANTRCRDSSTAADASVSAPEPTSTRGTLRPITSKSGADDERTALPPTTGRRAIRSPAGPVDRTACSNKPRIDSCRWRTRCEMGITNCQGAAA
jgi:hypothetical protein